MRRFNYTGRRRIKKSDVLITLYPQNDGGLEFEAIFDPGTVRGISEMGDRASVFVEAYSRTKFERFDFGTIATPSDTTRHKLKDFRFGEIVRFQVKVVDMESHTGRIAALAKNIRLSTHEESHQKSLLPVTLSPLNNLVFKVDFPDDNVPVLVLNEVLDDVLEQGIKSVTRHPLFISLVFPEAVRQILTRILLIEGDFSEDDDETSGYGKWKRFACSLNTEPLPVAEAEEGDFNPILDWIDAAVSQLSRRHLHVIHRFQQGVS